jgi:hypothetical protein
VKGLAKAGPFFGGTVMDILLQNSSAAAFRAHRHDVLNALQLIRAYIQLNRPNDALRAVDNLATWLQSIGNLQNQLGDEHEDVLWLFVRCPHVHIRHMARFPDLCESALSELRALWYWLEEQCSNQGFRRVEVEVHHAAEEGLEILLDVTEEMDSWWNTIHNVNSGEYGFGQRVTLKRKS